MKKTIFMALFACAFMIAGVAKAQSPAKSRNQKARIATGVRQGQLTRPETRMLARQQHHIGKMKMQARADGRVTCKERRNIKKAEHRADVAIYRQRHNHRNRW